MNDINERLLTIEKDVAVLKEGHTNIKWMLGIFIAASAAFALFVFTQFGRLEDKMDAMPGKIADGNKELILTLSSAITAAKQQAPQVILVPAQASTPSHPVSPEKKP